MQIFLVHGSYTPIVLVKLGVVVGVFFSTAFL